MVNNVIKNQKLFQSQPNVALWKRHPRSKFLLYPFYACFAVSMGVSVWYTGRTILVSSIDMWRT
ncbi:YALI0E12628p [Yarrowia lipolytica CLIB122]|uniref:YALI0E12628p n=2 Tax=Yarrowia lipolytica TaxID=4952 RepID=B5FVH7_YARLI|nr:YALI0E12628p [Yarrowia lipolytica CLIB122]AOW05335.1 hypothetical protein YALI1_E15606g [Yarrowia lipolytica]CAR64331.1 YALI0E12628p [Yarrowia lipolytica CLIB122]|eukprot:XP_002143072.1 YALI0E12628p [Yarrowia lipolytica CLIB122]